MGLLVAINGWDRAPWLERFRRELPDQAVLDAAQPHDPASVRYAATWKHAPGSLAGYPNLKIIFSLGAGVDHILCDPRIPDVPVVRCIDADLTNRMSEWVVMHALIHLRQYERYRAQQRERRWEDDDEQLAACDVTVGVMGLGVLGRDAAEKLGRMGFRVVGWTRSTRDKGAIPVWSGDEGLDPFLAEADIVVCLLPLTPDTRGMLNLALFRRMKRKTPFGGAILMNAGRGGLQVEADILAALDQGLLGAATLDVFETEPLPSSSHLWQHPQVTISPHNAASSTPAAIVGAIVRQIHAFERGAPLSNVVDRMRGY